MAAGLVNLLRNRALLLLAALVGLVCGLIARDGGFVDLQVYCFGGAAVLDDGRLYAEGTPGTGLPFTYPPFAALVLTPLAAVPFPLAVAAWSSGCVLALGWVISRIVPNVWHPESRSPGSKRWGLSRGEGLVGLLTLLALGLEPVWATLAFGQINLFLMGLIVADLMAPHSPRAGILTGIAAGVKLTPLIFLVHLVLIREPRAAARAGLAFAGTIAVGFALAPEASGAYWTRLLWDASRVGGVPFASNQSVMGSLFRLLGHEPSTVLWFVVAGAAALGILVSAAFVWRRGHHSLAVCIASMSMLVASPISWSHHWVWAVPAAIALWGVTRIGAALWAGVFASGMIWYPPHRDDLELGWVPVEHVIGNAYLIAALLLPAYAAVAVARRTRAELPAERAQFSEV
jgi:alpha-1,2-mannosyltransferase